MGETFVTLIGLAIFAYVMWSDMKSKPASAYWTDDMCEQFARKNGWVADAECNPHQFDGVRQPQLGKWACDWKGACEQIEKSGQNPCTDKSNATKR